MTKQAIMREPGMLMDWLLRGSCCGIVKRVPTRSRIGSMRLLSPIVRMSMRSGPILVLVLLVASSAEASRRTRRPVSPRVCDPHTTTLHQLKRQPHTFGGPVAPPSQRLLLGLSDPMTRIARATATDDDDDGQAIQNDAPAAQIDADCPFAVLTPLGLLARSIDPRPHTRAFSPKSPRGPPVAVTLPGSQSISVSRNRGGRCEWCSQI